MVKNLIRISVLPGITGVSQDPSADGTLAPGMSRFATHDLTPHP